MQLGLSWQELQAGSSLPTVNMFYVNRTPPPDSVDLLAAKIQLAELHSKEQDLRDQQLAMQLMLEDLDGEDAVFDALSTPESQELEVLQTQMNNLAALITTAEDEQVRHNITHTALLMAPILLSTTFVRLGERTI